MPRRWSRRGARGSPRCTQHNRILEQKLWRCDDDCVPGARGRGGRACHGATGRTGSKSPRAQE
eukprot:4274736-Lingulodinium_polyedra.AAC.1